MLKFIEYERVMPRDFFNEAKLLKCLGQLSLKIHDADEGAKGVVMHFCNSSEGCKIVLCEEGVLIDNNVEVRIQEEIISVYTTYNSKGVYPLDALFPDFDEVRVFDESGNFTTEFINKKEELLCKGK